VIGGLLAVAALGATSATAVADNTGANSAPPVFSGKYFSGPYVFHCDSGQGNTGVIVFNSQGTIVTGTCFVH
jgi:hypothetical protein